MQSEVLAFTEYEEDILFDVDDPDFAADGGRTGGVPLPHKASSCSLEARVPSPMSLARVRTFEGRLSDDVLSGRSFGSSYDELHQVIHEPPVFTIEDLRSQLNSCFTCGVSWQDHHVSLDCAECGGYSMERPCPRCDGQCDNLWKRDLSLSHTCRKARWQGECGLKNSPQPRLLLQSKPSSLPISPSGMSSPPC